MKFVIKNAHIVDPSQNLDGKGDIAVEGSLISGIGENLCSDGTEYDRIIDASGLYAFPGFIDMAVYLNVPGYEFNETFPTGTKAALNGGFTSLCCLPNTNPPNDNDSVTSFVVQKSAKEGLCNVFPIGGISKNLEGKALSEMGMMADAGCVAFSDGRHFSGDSMLMRRALEYSKQFNTPLVVFPEDRGLAKDGVMNEGAFSTVLGLRGIPSEAEVIEIKRDIELAALTESKIHFAGVSTKGGVEAVRRAKKRGVQVTASTCPHYFTLTEKAVADYDTNAKVRPPLRTETDIEAIKEALADGTIDCISSGHDPIIPDEKNREFDLAPFGISGIETAFGLCFELFLNGTLAIGGLVEKLAVNPARILNLEKGTLVRGGHADIVLADPGEQWEVTPDSFYSKGKNTPFASWKLKGRTKLVVVGGKIFDPKEL